MLGDEVFINHGVNILAALSVAVGAGTKIADLVVIRDSDTHGIAPGEPVKTEAVKIGRPAKEFREACRAQGVIVARDFPPFEKTHARVSIGTLEEMRRATEVFANILGVKETRRAA